VLVGEVKMTRDEVKAIVRDTTLFGWSNSWLDSYYRRLQAPPAPAPKPASARLAAVSK
jgi:hypothetical protein